MIHELLTPAERVSAGPARILRSMREYLIERKMIADESGSEVFAGHSTSHRVVATEATEAITSFSEQINAEILGKITTRAETAQAIIEVGGRVYKVIVVPLRPMIPIKK